MKRDRMKVASGSEGEVDVFSDSETGKLLAYVGDDATISLRNRLIVHLLLYTGLRVSELCSVRLADVDQLGMTLRVIGKDEFEDQDDDFQNGWSMGNPPSAVEN